MNDSLRIFLYLCVCIPIRILIALLTSMLQLQGVACVAFFVVSFRYVWTATHATSEGILGGEAWWAELRAFHAGSWLISAICVLAGFYYGATVILLLDVIVGGVMWGMSAQKKDELVQPIVDRSDIII